VRRPTIGFLAWALASLLSATGCDPSHGPVAPDISGPLGSPLPTATAEQLATFERGREVSLRRFDRRDGLGPAFNVTFCTSCHERPTVGGAAGLYRSFFLGGERLPDGTFQPAESAGMAGGVIRLYSYGDASPARPLVPPETNTIAVRNPIPFFGVGLLAEIEDTEILRRADPDDADGDGISGRPNYDRGFVGRFGRKAQTVSIEGFIRGPLFNHLGVTTDPLTNEQRSLLPVNSSVDDGSRSEALVRGDVGSSREAQASAPGMPTTDDDDAPDPELSSEDLFDLVSFAMLLAAPAIEEPTGDAVAGRQLFDELRCGACHAPRLNGPRGPIPVYSDLLLHDMGPELADGLDFLLATASEFRTQPLWGIAAVGPYLHDGRAGTLEEAILAHGGEAEASRDAFAALPSGERALVVAFLETLGGRGQYTGGLIPPGTPVPAVGALGGPVRELDSAETYRFVQGRALFDRELGFGDGVGAPRLNGDSCRACHFDPVVGGSGPRGVNVMRHGILRDGEFVEPTVGTVLHRTTSRLSALNANRAQVDATIFEHRQTPTLLGLGLLEAVPEETIVALADPDDAITPDGITGRVSRTDGGRLGRFGWKAQIPSLLEFVRDALTTEMGLTVPFQPGQDFGRPRDNDSVADPEVSLDEVLLLESFLRLLAPPPRATPADPALAAHGEEVFAAVGCALCHVPALDGPDGPVRAYTDLLLHEILPPGALGIEERSANMRELRTAPLWGLRDTAPYFHSGEADTIEQAVGLHDGEAAAVRDAFLALSGGDRDALLAFLESL
jgi:CxxC motif-containing protein (DUF1111 family)